VAKAGYLYTELGPQGFLPQDPAQLNDELAARGLTVSGGTVFAGLHKGKEALDKAIEDFGREARLLSAVGARYLVHLPEQYTDMHSGQATEGADLDAEQWQNLCQGTNELGRVIKQEYGVDLVFHPHVDTHVDTQDRIERFLSDTDPQFVNLCLDTGHISYCRGDNVQIIERFPERITYVHLKQVDPEVRDLAVAEQLPLSEAVKLGVMVEPPFGEPPMPPLLAALAALDRDIYCVIEQDLYPVQPDVPLPIAARTAGYFVSCGLGPTRRWPYHR
jgi:inosose dehydratase